jgi:hypothetical protein
MPAHEQTQSREEWVLFSAKLTKLGNFTHEKNYSPFLLKKDAVVWAMEYYQEHLRGRRFILYTDHKPLETLGTQHTKAMHRLQPAMMDFEIGYKKGSEMPADFLSRSFTEISAISALVIDWVHEQEKDNLSTLI